MHIKGGARLVMPGWARSSRGSQSRGICCVWGLPFRLPARGWIHGVLFHLLSQVPHLQRAREHALRTPEGEHRFLEDVRDTPWEPWGCRGACDWPPRWAWSPVFVPFIGAQPSTSHWRVSDIHGRRVGKSLSFFVLNASHYLTNRVMVLWWIHH